MTNIMKEKNGAVAAVTLMLMLAGGANAAALPKAESAVAANVVTVGDIFEGVASESVAGHVLAPAPEREKPLTLTTRDLQRISSAFNLGWQTRTGQEQTIVRSALRTIDRHEIEAALQQEIAALLPGQKFDMQLNDRRAALSVPEDAETTLVAEGMRTDPVKGTFSAVITALEDGTPVAKTEVAGRLTAIVSVPVLKTALRQGDIVSENDILYIDMEARAVSASTVTDAAKLLGRTPRRGLSAMKPVSTGDVQAPDFVKKGETVTLTLKQGILHLALQGKALESGAEGATVRVLNPSSNQVVEGVVTGLQAVAVSPTSVQVLASR